jgi:tRNA pseudouridine38-40 synthase
MQLKLTIEYDGTNYCGWQIQPNGPTIQEELEKAATKRLGRPVRMAAAGRTDAGVHALGQVVCFRLEEDVEAEDVRRALDALTPDDIVVREAEKVGDDFDPRRSARRRTYVYQIWNRATPQIVMRRFAWLVRKPLDLDAMQEAAALLVGERDFSSFQAADCDAVNPVRRVDHSGFTRDGALLTYRVSATAFLRHMVRNIVGTLVEVGRGERSVREFARLIEARDRTLAGPTAPAKGLFLVSVEYDAGR